MRHQCKAEEMSQECRQALAQTVQPLPSSAREFATSTPVASLSGHGIEDLEESAVGDTQVDQSSASQAAEDSASERDPVEHPFRCLYCKGRYKTAAKLADHIRRRHPEGKPYPCQECKCEYKAVAPLRKHVDAVHRERKFNCPECDFTTKTKQNLQEHAHLHKETFCCFYCKQYKPFTSARNVSKHLQEVHKLPQRLTKQCPICDFNDDNLPATICHVKTHFTASYADKEALAEKVQKFLSESRQTPLEALEAADTPPEEGPVRRQTRNTPQP